MVVDFFTFLSRREYELCRKIQRERVNLWVPVKSAKKKIQVKHNFFFNLTSSIDVQTNRINNFKR